MRHCGTQPLETDRLILRRFTADDAAAMYRNWASDPEVTRFLTWPTHGSVEVTQMVIGSWLPEYEKPSYYHWAIVPKELGEPIGNISAIIKERTATAHIGYCIGRNWWHHGYTSEALAAVMTFFFDTVGAQRIESMHDPRNPHSGNVMKKCGMTYEGTMRQADWSNQGICDACLYALLKSER